MVLNYQTYNNTNVQHQVMCCAGIMFFRLVILLQHVLFHERMRIFFRNLKLLCGLINEIACFYKYVTIGMLFPHCSMQT